MEEPFVTDYMKNKERENLFKGFAEILIGFMLVLIAIFIQVAFYVSIIPILIGVAGIVSFVIGIFSVKRVLYDKSA